MDRSSTRRLKTFISLLIMVILGPLGNVLLRKGMQAIGTTTAGKAAALGTSIAQVLSSVTIWLGIACLMMYLLAEMLVLSWADYSYVQPVSASAYGVVALMGYLVLGEDISRLRWLGVFVICLGVLAVGRTSPRTTGTTRS